MSTLDVHDLEPLLQRVLAGDGQAFNELLARLRRYMHGLVNQQLDGNANGPIDHSEVVQSALRRIHEHFNEWKGSKAPSLLSWVRSIVHNRVIEELRRSPPRVLSLGSDIAVLADPRPPDESQERADLAAAVASALAQLPDRLRRVVETRWFERQPDERTAQELGITVNHVHQLRFQALEKLRPLLKHLEEASP
jgi:RNA polymerase sigma factor (sigma-70 family)